jgi:hypothetical protein
MGIIRKGILGGFQGTVGTVVGGTWKGIDYIKSLPVISNTDPSPKQLEQRAKFKTVVDFLRPILAFVQLGFKTSGSQMTGYNSAMSYNYKNALIGNYPALSIDYSLAAVSSGSLPNVLAPDATAEPASVVKFDWTNNSNVGVAAGTDKVMVVVYCPSVQQAVYTMAGADRADETLELNCAQFSGKQVHTWIACITEDERNIANSIYTGQLLVS